MSGVKCDIIIVADATLSLHESLSSLKRILFESTLLSTLARSVDRFGAVLYGDYTAVDRYPVVRWSGWFQSHRGFSPFLEGGQLGPGGDPPEAVKTALSLVCDVVEASYPGKCDNGIPSQKRTLVIWHGDAPPHHPANQDGHPNYRRELSALGRDFDWIGLCKRARDLGVIAFPLIASGDRDTLSYFQCLAYMTGGCANVVANVGDGSTWTGLTLTMVLRYLGCGTDLLPCIKDDAARGLAWKQDPKRIFKAEVTENDAPGYLPSRKIANKKKSLLNLNVQAGSVVVSVIQLEIQGAISVPKASFKPGLSMKELRSAFSNDASFAARVLSVLTDLVSDIDALMTLTSSKLFSCLWREAVSVRSTAQTVLLSTFHKTLAGNVDQGKRATLKTWLEQGYDASDDIQQAISAIPVNSRFPALVFTGEITSIARPQDLTIISSTCKPTSLKKLIRFLHQIRIVRANDAQLIQRNVEARRQPLPVALPATHLVPMLPSLLFPGLMFSARASAVLAMILLVAGVAVKELVQKARLYLGLLKGTWLVTGMARNWSFGFLRLVKRLGDVMPLTEVFTPDEEESLIATLLIQGTFMNRRTDISLTVFFGGDGILLPDRKVPCTGGCNRSVSFTLATPDGLCVFCLKFGVARTTQLAQTNSQPVGWFRQCTRCSSHYGIYTSTDAERVPARGQPLCHYCREGRNGRVSARRVLTCQSCSARYVAPGHSNDQTTDMQTVQFVCPSCAAGQPIPTETLTVTLEQLWCGNECTILQAVGLQPAANANVADLFRHRTAFSLRHHFTGIFKGTADPESLRFAGRTVTNQQEVLDAIHCWVRKHRAELATCMMCFDEIPKDIAFPSCGRKGCDVRCCQACLDRWYGELAPGWFIPPANTRCVFCRRPPTYEVLLRHNRVACQLRRAPMEAFDPAWHYGFCLRCNQAKRWVERVCAAEPPAGDDFRCEDCNLLANARSVFTRDCPACRVTIEKAVGCDHVTCGNCQDHFCWRCGTSQPANQIYQHISSCLGDDAYQAHGGGQQLGGGGYAGLDDEDDYDD